MHLVVSLFLFFPCLALSADVLIIESYHKEYAWDASYVVGIKTGLGDEYQIERFEMNTKRLPKEKYQMMANKAYKRYQELKPRIVILGDDNAFNYLLPQLYNEPISILFLGVNSNPRKLMNKYKGQAEISGILEQPLFVKNIGEVGAMLPSDKKKIIVLFDSGITSKIASDYMHLQYNLIQSKLGIEVDILNIGALSDWKAAIKGAASQGVGAIIVGLYHTIVDSEGRSVNADDILAWTNQNSTVPLFGFWDFSVGIGKTAGGVVLFGEAQGLMIGDMAKSILNEKKRASDIPIQVGVKGRAIYSPTEFERWNLAAPPQWEAVD
ncbi:ABC transporter substrate-binding protein [Vibrio sp. TRT 17S01]|uniref:ABC transporter substrate-binding protein n=1 Tax=Vibrio sp. TRT 17S01 TaxID=3418505 RepID=UPI003CEB7F22